MSVHFNLKFPFSFRKTGQVLMYCNSLLDPMIYSLKNRKMNYAVKKMLCGTKYVNNTTVTQTVSMAQSRHSQNAVHPGIELN